MVSVDLFTVNLLYATLLVVPGLLGLKLYLIGSRRINDYSRLDAIVYSLGISILSIFSIYLLSSLILWKLVDFSDIQSPSLPFLIGLYMLHVAISCSLGGLSGHLDDARLDNNDGPFERLFGYFDDSRSDSNEDVIQEELWDYIFDDIYSESRVRVVKIDGTEIEGTVAKYGDAVQSRDIILSSAYEMIPNREGEENRARGLGKYTYIHEQDISHIEFDEDLNEDLDMETLRELGYRPEREESQADEEATRRVEEDLDEIKREMTSNMMKTGESRQP